MGNPIKRIRDSSVQTKLTLLAATAITLAVAVACIIFVVLDARRVSVSKATQLIAIAEMLGTNSTAAVAFGQQEAAEDLLRAAERRESIRIACILDLHGNVFAICGPESEHSQFDPHSIKLGAHYTEDGFLEVAVPISEDGDRLGTLFLRESSAELNQALRSQVSVAAIVLAISIVIGVFASSHLQEFVTGPILRLASAAEQISRSEDCTIRVSHDCKDEIGTLYHQFNGMLDRVELREKAINQASERLHELNQALEERVAERTRELEQSNLALHNQIKAKDVAREQLQRTHAQLLEVSRRAGMADIANGVLHNIGNVLNSLNISANLIDERIRDIKFASLEKAIQLLNQHEDDLAIFLTESDQGKLLPRFLGKLSESMRDDQTTILEEVESLASNVEHIKDIVRAQQSHAGAFGVLEQLSPHSLFDDAIVFVQDSISRHNVEIIKDYSDTGLIEIEKSKAIQIIINLIKNAKESVLEHDSEVKRVTLRVESLVDDLVFQVIDSGIGIAPERITAIFSNGYSTKKEGHGFGLHASATAAVELGGKLSVQSDGLGRGATFTLTLPRSARTRRKSLIG